MRAWSTTVALTLALGTAIAGMLGPHARAEIGHALDPPERMSASVEPARAFVLGGNPLWAVPLRDLSATLDRPIFSASRRPPTPPVIASTPPTKPVIAMPQVPDRPPLVLLGTIIGGSLRVGIFHEVSTTKTVRLSVGESRQGWILRSVSANDANFEAADRVATLVLRPAFQLAMKDGKASQPTEPIPAVMHRRR
jgi:hypothetical protein